MAATDWSELSNSAATSIIARGVTSAVARPNGGGSYLYGFNSLLVDPGAAGLFCNHTNFAPTPANKGAMVCAAVQRGVSGGGSGFSPALFVGLQGPDVSDLGYLLGIGDSDPGHIVLKKGSLAELLDDVAPSPADNGVLLRSTGAIAVGEWAHLRLDMIVQGSGDVVLQCRWSDLATHAVTAPSWQVIPGMEGDQYPTITGFVDDALGVNSGTVPFTNGRIGFGFRSEDVTRRGFFDQLIVARQA